jgi:MoxR-like ATPase
MKKTRTHFLRKDLIALSALILYLLFEVLIAICIDGTGAVIKTTNPIAKLAKTMGFTILNGSWPAWILLIVLALYTFLLVAALLFEVRMAQYYDHLTWTKKWATVYGLTILVDLVLAFGIGCACQYPFTAEYFHNSFLFVGQAIALSLLLFLFVALFIGNFIAFIVNCFRYNKPLGIATKEEKENASESPSDEDKTPSKETEVEENELVNSSSRLVSTKNAMGLMEAYDAQSVEEANKAWDKEKVFPGLSKVDYDETGVTPGTFEDNKNLKEIAEGFRNYLAKNLELYFRSETIRAFIAGLHASRLLILEGLSGTGKTSLARYWSEYLGEQSFFEPVQATWRDRTSLLGYYNDFSSSYHETEFLKRLYRASYRERDINVMVLDEINISRVEYYFADFLSILEYPTAEWRMKILELPVNATAPAHLKDGVLLIPETSWFIGTANTDDSTFTITDKVVDRAITIDFDERNEPFAVKEDAKKISLSYDGLEKLFAEAEKNPSFAFSKDDYAKFKGLLDFVDDRFGVAIGNRIMHQISLFVPVYIAEGGSKNEALDFMFAQKVVSKLKGRYEDYMKSGLLDLEKKCEKLYGNDFALTHASIERILKKLV